MAKKSEDKEIDKAEELLRKVDHFIEVVSNTVWYQEAKKTLETHRSEKRKLKEP